MSPPSRGLRILMTTDSVGGVWAYSAELAKGLGRRGHHVHLLTLGPPPQPQQIASLESASGISLQVTDLALEWMDPAGADLPRARRKLALLEQQTAPDIVHLNGYREASAPWRAPVLVVAHSCVRSWWLACRGEEPREPCWSRYIANVEAGLAAADRWVAPTAAFRDAVQALYAPAAPGGVIPNGIDRPCESRRKDPFILAAGRMWDEAKNLGALAAVASAAGWPVHVAGEATAPSAGGETDPAFAAAGHLFLLGALPHDELMQHMQRAGIFAAPHLYEPFGLAVLEAASAGCALVLSDIATLRELWDGAALFVPRRDATALQDTLQRLCRDSALRAKLQAAAARRARRYTAARMVAAYQEVYRSMLTGAAPDARGTGRRLAAAAEMAQ